MTKRNARLELGDRSRARICRATLELLAERGFAGTTISAIAKRSGLPAGSLYWHFGNKGRLLTQVAEETATEWLKLIPDWDALKGSMPNRLRQMLRFIARGVEDQPEHVQLVMMLYLGAPKTDPVARRQVRMLRKASFAKLRPAAEALLDHLSLPRDETIVRKLTTFALAFCNGCAVNYRIEENSAELVANLESLSAAWPAVAKELVAQACARNGIQARALSR